MEYHEKISLDRSPQILARPRGIMLDELTGQKEFIVMRAEAWETYFGITRWTAQDEFDGNNPVVTPAEIYEEIRAEVEAGKSLSLALEEWLDGFCDSWDIGLVTRSGLS